MHRNRSRQYSNKQRGTRPAMSLHQHFPKSVRDELRMTCALRGFSAMREGDGKSLPKQYIFMHKFYHGDNNKAPSQIRMLAEGMSPYNDLYSSKERSVCINQE